MICELLWVRRVLLLMQLLHLLATETEQA